MRGTISSSELLSVTESVDEVILWGGGRIDALFMVGDGTKFEGDEDGGKGGERRELVDESGKDAALLDKTGGGGGGGGGGLLELFIAKESDIPE